MRIGFDLDDTIVNIYDSLIEKAILYDKLFLEGKGIIDKEAYNFTEMFDWTLEDKNDFFMKYLEEVINNASLMENAKEIINKLKKDGNEIYIISARKLIYTDDPYIVTKKWLEDKGIMFDKLIVNSGTKGIVCKENSIDIFFDDKENQYIDIASYGINVFLFDRKHNRNNTTLNRVHNWNEIYNVIMEVKYGRESNN